MPPSRSLSRIRSCCFFSASRRFTRVHDILVPIHSPLQPLSQCSRCCCLVLASHCVSHIASALPHRTLPLWRRLHYLVFPAAILLFVHSILTDPDLKDGHPDLLDGGKVFVEIAALLCFVATVLRFRLRGKGLRPVVPSSETARVLSEPKT